MFAAILQPIAFLSFISFVTVASLAMQVPAINERTNAKADKQASSDLQDIQYAIQSSSLDGELPASLNDSTLKEDFSTKLKTRLSDYEYIKASDGSYKLCAVFKTDTTASKSKKPASGSNGSGVSYDTEFLRPSYTVDLTVHPAGRHCFDYESASGYRSYNTKTDSYYENNAESGGSIDKDASLQEKAADIERQTDIKSLASQVEVYYTNGEFASYPSVQQFNDDGWRKQNFPGIGESASKGPAGEKPGSGYDYATLPAGCKNTEGNECVSFTLKVKYSNGSTLTKSSLNDY